MNGHARAGVRAGLMLAGVLLFVVILHLRLERVPPANYEARDDAVITLSHARNLVEYGFIGVSPSGERVEGFSTPLQFLVAGVAYTIHPFGYRAFFRWQTLIGTMLLGALAAVAFARGAERDRPLWWRYGFILAALAA